MYFEFHKAAILSCRVLLRPIIKLFLTFGLSYGEFVEVAKFAYLSAVTKDGSVPTNISQTAVRTGISRKAIRKLLKRHREDQVVLRSEGLSHIRLLALWRESSRYLDDDGKPLPLNYSGDDSVTLLSLINELETDIPPSSLLKRLLSINLIDINEDGKYTPKIHDPTPSVVGPDTLLRASFFAAAHIDTIANNFDREADKRRMERQTYSVKVPRDLRDDLLDQIRDVCSETFSEIEKIVSAHEISGETESLEVLGIGMYTFDFQLPTEDLAGVFDGIGR